MKKGCLVALLVTILLFAGGAFAQTSSGEISGRVVDQADAVVTDAEVTLTNQATGEIRVVSTDKTGEFTFVAIQPGTFTVTVSAPKFRKFEKRDLKLSASERLSAGTLKLAVGAAAETLVVTAEATPVQTESSERSALLDSKELSNLMTIGRDPLGLMRVLPGVVKDGGGSGSLGTQGAGTIAGVRESSNAVSIDGVNGNPRGDGNKLDTPIVMDAVSEIKVVLNNYQAEYGQSAGAIINLTTKSGTQNFHGTGYYYGRNDAFNANSWLNNYKNQPRDPYRYNVWGYNLGGPVYIPGKFNRDKNKLFFFFNQERWPIKTTGDWQYFMMPTAAERNGDFSNTYDTKGQPVYIRDPLLNGTCKAGTTTGCLQYQGRLQVIDPARINANTQKLMRIFPLPMIDCTPLGAGNKTPCPLTGGTTGNPYNFSLKPVREEPKSETVLRVDYNLNSKWHMFFRGLDMSSQNSGFTSTAAKLPWGIPAYYSTPAQNASINLTYVASPTLVNEFTMGYASWKELQNFVNASDLDKVSRSALGIALGQNNPAQNPTNLVPRVTKLSSGGGSGTFQLAEAPSIDFDNRWPMDNNTGTWEFSDGLTKIWNRHTFKTGVFFQAGRYVQRHIGSVFDGNYVFGVNSSNPYDTQYAYSNMLLGSYSSYEEGSNAVDYAPHWHILEWYLQDSWKAKSNLTIDYGVRFTYDLPTVLKPGMGAGWVQDRYNSSQVPALYKPVASSTLTQAQKDVCKGAYKSTPTRCAMNPITGAIMPDTFINTFVSPFNFSGMVVNTDPSYPESLRYSNGVLLAPRFGISWDPFHDGKTAIRFGTGLYYNTREGGGTVGDYSTIPPLATNASISFGQIGSNFQPGCGATSTCYDPKWVPYGSPVDTRVMQPNRKVESTLGTHFGIQRNVGFDTVVDLAYVGTFGRHLNQQINLNAIPYLTKMFADGTANPKYVDNSQSGQNCFYYAPHHNGTTLCQAKMLDDKLIRPIAGYGAINLRDYGSTSNYNALQASVNRRFTKGLQFGLSYTWSKTMTYQDTVNGAIANFQDRRYWNYSEADFDRTHILVYHWTASLPKASRLWNNPVMKAIGDNWEWSGIAEFVSGHPLPVLMSGNPELTGGGDGSRALLVGDPYAPREDVHKTTMWLNKDSFAAPPVGVVPNASIPNFVRNAAFRGPGTNNWDMALQKNIPVTERLKLTIRAEAYNVFNHVSFTMKNKDVPVTADFDTANKCDGAAANDMRCGSGLIKSSSAFGQVDGERGPRRLQLSARFTF